MGVLALAMMSTSAVYAGHGKKKSKANTMACPKECHKGSCPMMGKMSS